MPILSIAKAMSKGLVATEWFGINQSLSRNFQIIDVNYNFDCAGPRILLRKDVDTLDAGEQAALVKAMHKVVSSGEFAKIANFHGSPYTMCNQFDVNDTNYRDFDFRDGCCPHGVSEFLIWHRLYMVNMEQVSFVLFCQLATMSRSRPFM